MSRFLAGEPDQPNKTREKCQKAKLQPATNQVGFLHDDFLRKFIYIIASLPYYLTGSTNVTSGVCVSQDNMYRKCLSWVASGHLPLNSATYP